MGVRGLLRHLDAYGEYVCYDRVATSHFNAPRQLVVIDGPSLAYHIHNKCLSDRLSVSNYQLLQAVPSYALIGAATLEWLHQLQLFNFDIHAIYFDGALPHEKTTERIARLDAAILESQGLKQAVPAGFSARSANATSPVKNTSSDKPNGLSDLLNPASFLVNAVLEALRDSDFAAVTQVVSGEADAFCANAARAHNIFVLTSDSDLLLYDLGQRGAVLLLSPIDVVDIGNGKPSLSTKQFRPKTIAAKLGLSDLLGLGYVLSQDQYKSIHQAIEKLQHTALSSDSDFAEFRAVYTPAQTRSSVSVSDASLNAQLQELLTRLDPRVSEVVHSFRTAPSERQSKDPQPLPVYLPVLLEDSQRASAWSMSTAIRQVALSLLHSNTLRVANYAEYDRRGPRTTANVMPILSRAEARKSLHKLTEQIRVSLTSIARLPAFVQWRLCACRLLVSCCIDTGRSCPDGRDMTDLVLDTPRAMTWDAIHLQAQLYAVLYSVRILKQLGQVAKLSLDLSDDIQEEVDDALQILKNMPGIVGLFDPVVLDEEVDRGATRKSVYKSLLEVMPQEKHGRSEEPECEYSTKKARRKKTKREAETELNADGGSLEVGHSRSISNNPFALLGDIE